MWPFKRKEPETETRASGANYTAMAMAARAAFIGGTDDVGELSGTVASCVDLWTNGLSIAEVSGASDLLTPRILAMTARSLALRGEALFKIEDDRLTPCSDWDVSTRFARPVAYRVGIPDVGGGTSETLLAPEVLHFRVGSDPELPFHGQSPLRRARLTAGLLQALESALSEIYTDGPFGSGIIPMPEQPDVDMTDLARAFRGLRGRVMVRESVSVTAAGGPQPQTDLSPHSVSPDMSRAMFKETLAAARASIEMAYGVLPCLSNPASTGPAIREGQRHLATWVLTPVARMIGEECSEKLGGTVELDVLTPLQALDAGGRARALKAIIDALAAAKAGGVDPEMALKLLDWSGEQEVSD